MVSGCGEHEGMGRHMLSAANALPADRACVRMVSCCFMHRFAWTGSSSASTVLAWPVHLLASDIQVQHSAAGCTKAQPTLHGSMKSD